MALAPDVLQRINLETVEKDLAIYEAGVRHSMESGWAAWGIATPSQRLRGYEAMTWPEDLPLVLTEDYIDLFHAGVMPPLRAMIEWQKITQPEPDGKGGQIIPQPSDYRPYYWGLLAICPPYVFNRDASDFRNLLRAEQAKASA